MKKTLLILMALALSLCLAAPALAAGAAAPKQLCLHLDTTSSVDIILSIKLNGTVKGSAGPIKFYAIHGEANGNSAGWPIAGTGHIQNGIFHFSVTGSMKWPPNDDYQRISMEGKWNLATGTGTYTMQVFSGSIVDATFDSTLSAKDCAILNTEYNANAPLSGSSTAE